MNSTENHPSDSCPTAARQALGKPHIPVMAQKASLTSLSLLSCPLLTTFRHGGLFAGLKHTNRSPIRACALARTPFRIVPPLGICLSHSLTPSRPLLKRRLLRAALLAVIPSKTPAFTTLRALTLFIFASWHFSGLDIIVYSSQFIWPTSMPGKSRSLMTIFERTKSGRG